MDTAETKDTTEKSVDTVAEKVIAILGGIVQRDPSSISQDEELFSGLGLESTAFLEVLMQAEDELGIEFDPYDLEPNAFETVATLITFIRKQIQA
jgi:acyl carrier protein